MCMRILKEKTKKDEFFGKIPEISCMYVIIFTENDETVSLFKIYSSRPKKDAERQKKVHFRVVT